MIIIMVFSKLLLTVLDYPASINDVSLVSDLMQEVGPEDEEEEGNSRKKKKSSHVIKTASLVCQ